jgi:indole-3-glycerol phosphate synthase
MNVLDKIKAYKLEDVAARKVAVPLAEVESRANAASPPVALPTACKRRPRQAMP